MSTVIKSGTIVTADTTYPADVLIENGVIAAIGRDLSGDTVLGASGSYVMRGQPRSALPTLKCLMGT